jgi:hypothetical protein
MHVLAEVETRIKGAAADSLRHDPDSLYDELAAWVRGLDAASRAALTAQLPEWLGADQPSWRSSAVMELALRLDDEGLLRAAVHMARDHALQDWDALDEYPAWLMYHLELLFVIARWPVNPGDVARAYLEDLREEGVSAASYSRRLLGAKASVVACFLQPAQEQEACLEEILGTLRGWRDRRLTRSVLAMLHARCSREPTGTALLKTMLTDDEYALALGE